MPIIQTKKQSDIEKRLRLLRHQVYGKGTESRIMNYESREEKANTISFGSNSQHLQSDIVYLRHDLIKITLFTSVAFGVQIVLYLLLNSRFIKLPLTI